MVPKQVDKLKEQFAGLTPTESDMDSSGPKRSNTLKGENSDGSRVAGNPLRLKKMAEHKIEGKTGNPSQLGDPISLKAETDDYEPYETENGPDGQRQGRESKL